MCFFFQKVNTRKLTYEHASYKRHIIMIIIYAKSFCNPILQGNVWAGHEHVFIIAYVQSLNAQRDLDLSAGNKAFARDTAG